MRVQLERTSSAKLDEMLNFQKDASDKTSLGYNHSLSSCSTSSNALSRAIFVPPANNDNFEETEPKTENVSEGKLDKEKSILGALPKVIKKETKPNNHHSTSKKSQQKKPHFCNCHGASGHNKYMIYDLIWSKNFNFFIN